MYTDHQALHPSEKDVLDQLARILASDDFQRSQRLSAFLDFVVKKTLAGEEESLKASVIGVEVYGKAPGFDAEGDSSVRVEALRLRKTLALYYIDKGRNDPVVIQIPTGGYKAVFTPSITETPEPAAAPGTLAFRAALLAGMALCGLVLFTFLLRGNHEQQAHTPVETSIPIIAVMPFSTIGDKTAADTELAINTALVKELSAFDTLQTVSARGAPGAPGGNTDTAGVAARTNASYIIEGSLKSDDARKDLTVRLFDTKKKQYIWSFRKAYTPDDGQGIPPPEEMAGVVVSQIASPGGVIESLEGERIAAMDPRRAATEHCFARFHAYCNNKTAREHAEVRRCLEDAARREPANGTVFAFLSWIYGDETRYGMNPQGDAGDTARRSLATARKAVELAPRNARTHQYLANAAMLSNDFDLMRRHLGIAHTLNPYNAEILADMAWNLGQAGEWAEAEKHGLRSLALNPAHPRWYEGILAAYYFQAGDFETSLTYGVGFYQPEDLLSNLLLAGAYARQGRAQEAARIARHIEQQFPAFTKNPGKELETWKFRPAFNSLLIEAARDAGVQPGTP